MTAANLIASAAKIRPETFRHTRAVQLLGKLTQGLLPLRFRRDTVSLFVVGERKIVVNVGSMGRKFERVLVVRDRAFGFTRTRIVIGQRQVTGGCGWTLFQNCRKKPLRVPLLGCPQILAIARAVVKPCAAGELLRAIEWLGKALCDSLVAESAQESTIDCGCRLSEIESHQRGVGFVPHRRASSPSGLNYVMG